MRDQLIPAKRPELIFGLVAPVGVDLAMVSGVLERQLDAMSYQSSLVHLTKYLNEFNLRVEIDKSSFVSEFQSKISYANEIRTKFGDSSLAALAIGLLRQIRNAQRESRLENSPDTKTAHEAPLDAHAFIIRQFKVPAEINLMRRIYGRQFILISAYAPKSQRIEAIKQKQRLSLGGLASEEDIESSARKLVIQDDREASDPHGQNLRDCFPLGDVFIDATSREKCEETLKRFIELLFGSNRVAPTPDEYGMYIAKSASLRSSDLSRQVGAAIFSTSREVLTLGCNEVPRAGGGTYWINDDNDNRDIAAGHDSNEFIKKELFVDLVDRFVKQGAINEDYAASLVPLEIARKLLASKGENSVEDSRMMDIIEFGRSIHAEMSAISDAARKGIPINSATLFTTTFPCHLCAKHIVASGISRVVFIEPYPKSYATDLHGDSISVETECKGKVHFSPFIGISPYRYRELFEKGKRKYLGIAQDWHHGEKRPMIEVYFPSYFEGELHVMESMKTALQQETNSNGK